MRKILLALFGAAAIAAARLFGGPMDGTSWDVHVKPDSLLSFSRRGTLVFQRGRLNVLGALSGGDFSPGPYHAQLADGADADAVWNASLSHVDKDVMTWHGLVRGDTIEGMAIWWTRSGAARRFTFRGSRKAG